MKVFNIQEKRGSSKGIGKIPKPCHYHVGKSYIPNTTIFIYGWCCWAQLLDSIKSRWPSRRDVLKLCGLWDFAFMWDCRLHLKTLLSNLILSLSPSIWQNAEKTNLDLCRDPTSPKGWSTMHSPRFQFLRNLKVFSAHIGVCGGEEEGCEIPPHTKHRVELKLQNEIWSCCFLTFV